MMSAFFYLQKKVPSQNPAFLRLNMRNLPHKPTKFQEYKKVQIVNLSEKTFILGNC